MTIVILYFGDHKQHAIKFEEALLVILTLEIAVVLNFINIIQA